MSVNDYVQYGLKRGKDDNFGVNGYKVAYTCELDKPLVKKIHPGLRKTYVDDAIREKKIIPPAKYEIQGDLLDTKHKSFLCKAPRRTMADEIAAEQKR